MQTIRKIYKINGLCGSGKSFSLIEYLKQHNEEQKTLIVLPTINLAGQYKKSLTNAGIVNIHVINRDFTNNVHSEITKTIRQINEDKFGTLVITLAAFDTMNLGVFGHRNEWHFYCDEIPKVDFYYEPCIPYNKDELMHMLEKEYIINHSLYKLQLNKKYNVKGFLDRNHDDTDAIIKPIIQHCYNDDCVIADAKNWEKISNNNITNDKDVDLTHGNQQNKLYFVAFRNPNNFLGWAECIIMGANFDESLLYKYWSEYCDIEFITHPLQQQLRYQSHDNGNLLKITYLQEHAYSKSQGGKKVDDKSMTIIEDSIDKAMKYFEQEKVLCVLNNNDKKMMPTTWTDCPIVSHGLNHFQDFTCMYFGAALNRTPKHITMLEEFGIDATYLLRCTTHEVVYQNVSRIALRDPTNKTKCDVVVQDKLMAEALARLYPNCMIGPIDGVIKKAVPVAKSYMIKRKRLDALINHRKLNNTIFINEISELHNWHLAVTNSYKEGISNTEMPKIEGNIFRDIYSQTSGSYECQSVSEFVSEMKKWHTNYIFDKKTDNILYCPVVFKNETRRNSDSAMYSTALFMDVDDGDISPDEFHRIFSEIYPISHFITNSASRSSLKPNRFRSVFFVKERMDSEIYKIVFNHIVGLLKKQNYYTAPLTKKEGFYEKILNKNKDALFTGIDMGKNSLTSLFYAPCQIEGNEEWSFFWNFGTSNRDVVRYALDPTQIAQYAKFDEPLAQIIYYDPVSSENSKNNDGYDNFNYKKVDNLINQLSPGNRSTLSCRIGGTIKKYPHHMQENIYQKMRDRGCSEYQIRTAQKYANKP